jgi:septal ring factor EnvC (AmiA/AmiB activator)
LKLRSTRAALAAALVLALAGQAYAAPKQTNRSKEKAAAEATRASIQQKLGNLKKDIARTESAREDAADELAESEQAISEANRKLRDLADDLAATNQKLNGLELERSHLAATIDTQKKQLARLLRDQYVAGNEDRIKLLLSGDNPNRINRDLQMMAYVSQAQAKLLASLRANLAAIETNQAEVQNAKDELDEIAQEEREQKAVLVKERAKRAELMGALSKKLSAQRREIGALERDEQRLAGLVDRLAKIIREQQEAAAAEKRRKEALAAKAKADAEAAALARAAKEKAERERIARENAAKPPGAKPEVFKPDPIDDVEPPKVATTPPKAADKPEPDISLGPAAPAGAFVALKGKLSPPVSGKVLAKFGSKRPEGGPSWKGVFIKTDEGAPVKVVAAGRVIFSDWMRGFGNIIIVDHGSDYWTLYGNNQSVLKRVGDAVKPGEVIANAGNTGGNEESGLYFELRHLGTGAIDPARWVKF